MPRYLAHLLRRRGLGFGQALVQTVLHYRLRSGAAEDVDPTLERLLGRPGHTLAEYVQAKAEVWAR